MVGFSQLNGIALNWTLPRQNETLAKIRVYSIIPCSFVLKIEVTHRSNLDLSYDRFSAVNFFFMYLFCTTSNKHKNKSNQIKSFRKYKKSQSDFISSLDSLDYSPKSYSIICLGIWHHK